MQRLLAIDFNSRELAYAVASATGERITLESSGVVPLVDSAEDRPLTAAESARQLQSVLAKHKRSGTKVLVGVDRNSIELFEFTVPPASDTELPELVMVQSTMELSTIADESVIDFVAKPGPVTEPRQITVAAISRTELNHVNSVCTSAGLSPDRILVRSYETAALFLRRRTDEKGNSLLVNVIADEVDLIVVDRSQPIFFRTVRLPGRLEDTSAEQRLLHEIRRTLLIAPQNAESAQTIENVVVFGTSEVHQRIVQQLSQDGSGKAETLDPYSGFSLGDQWETQSSGRLIPLLGMLLEEVNGARHAIDFLHPRRPPKPPNRIRQILLATIVAMLAVSSISYFYWDSLSAADAENEKLAEELLDLEKLVKKTADKKKVTDAISDWNANSVVWLDELRDLSAKFPSGQDLVLQRLSMTPSRGGKASLSFQGLAREPNVVTRMESSLRDDRHEVQTPRVEERVQDKSYTWNFETAVSLSPEKEDPDNTTAPATERKSQKSAEPMASSKQPAAGSTKSKSAANSKSTSGVDRERSSIKQSSQK